MLEKRGSVVRHLRSLIDEEQRLFSMSGATSVYSLKLRVLPDKGKHSSQWFATMAAYFEDQTQFNCLQCIPSSSTDSSAAGLLFRGIDIKKNQPFLIHYFNVSPFNSKQLELTNANAKLYTKVKHPHIVTVHSTDLLKPHPRDPKFNSQILIT